MQELALENKLPYVQLVESAGANLLRYRVEDFVRGDEAAGAGHGAIHNDHGGLELLGEADCLSTIARFTDDYHIGLVFKQAPKAAANQAVIVHQKY